MEDICRVCTESSNGDQLESVFSSNIIDRLKAFIIDLERNMGFPHQICIKCISELNIAYEFRMKCISSDTKILKILSAFDEIQNPLSLMPVCSDSVLACSVSSDVSVKQEASDYVELSTFIEEHQINKLEEPTLIRNTMQENRQTVNTTKLSKSFQCVECSESFRFQKGLKDHVKEVHIFVYKCDQCPKEFKHKNLMNLHYKTHRTHKCPHCPKEFQKKYRMLKHARIHSNDKHSFVCTICSKLFTEAGNLLRHQKIHTGVRPFVCEMCGATFGQKTTLQAHMKTHDRLKKAIENQLVDGFTCKLCDSSFTGTGYLLAHLTRHHSSSIKDMIPRSTPKRTCETRNYKCTECEKCYLTKSQLTIHRTSHLSVKPYLCEECGKSCITHSMLKSHMLIHTNTKPYNCEECGMAFRLQSTLKIHFRQHSGVKPFTCKLCAKSFRQMQHLKRHMRCHTGEKPYPCEVCGKCFVDRNNVVVHMRQHTGDKPYKCQYCHMAFYDAPNLKKHTKKHEKLKEECLK